MTKQFLQALGMGLLALFLAPIGVYVFIHFITLLFDLEAGVMVRWVAAAVGGVFGVMVAVDVVSRYEE